VVVFVYYEHDIQVSRNLLFDLKNGTDYAPPPLFAKISGLAVQKATTAGRQRFLPD